MVQELLARKKKLAENVQRGIKIVFMNEPFRIFHKAGINT